MFYLERTSLTRSQLTLKRTLDAVLGSALVVVLAPVALLAALHERRRSGEGQAVDVSMADGALSWLALVAGRYFCDGEEPRRGEQQLAGGLLYLASEASSMVTGHTLAIDGGWLSL